MKSPRSIIIYRSDSSYVDSLPTGHQDSQGADLFLRFENVEGDVSRALDAAKPRLGECVINTIPELL